MFFSLEKTAMMGQMMEMMPLMMILTRYRLEALNIESLHSNGCLLLGKLGDEVLLDELFLWGNMIKPATSISQCSPYSIPSILPRWVVAFDCSLFCDVFFTGSTEKKVENGGQIVYDGIWSCKFECFFFNCLYVVLTTITH